MAKKCIYLTSKETGFTYRRYPESSQRSHRVYWQRKVSNGVRYLHVDLWEKENGQVPDGSHIHHIDHDPLNNEISNLTCLTPSEHRSHHNKNKTEAQAEQNRVHLAKIRPLTKTWHQSPEGRAKHAELAKKSWENRQPRTFVCQWCETVFKSTKTMAPLFCSNGCKTKSRYASGVDNILISCLSCGAERVINKYRKAPDLCKSCSNASKKKT